MQGFGFRFSVFRFRISGSGFRFSSFGFQIAGSRSRVSGVSVLPPLHGATRLSGSPPLALPGSGNWVSGFEFRTSGLALGIWGRGPSGVRFGVQGFGFCVSGFTDAGFGFGSGVCGVVLGFSGWFRV